MTSRLATGFALAVTAATLSACLPPNSAQTPRPVTPDDGPKGTVHVDYVGGSFTRQIQTRFRLDRAGYVLVGHLGGDGQIRVLYPETPRDRGWVAGGKAIAIKPHTAMYDVAPHLYRFITAPWRNLGAQMDSYDGRGHGYVFMIASSYPIDYGALADREDFETLEIEDYETTRDPRYAIRNLADDLVMGDYTLKFARNPSGSAYARATGCPFRWGQMRYREGFDYYPWMDQGYSFFSYPGISLLNGIQFMRLYGQTLCRGSLYASNRRFFTRFHGPTTVVVPPAGTPAGPLTPRLQRPTRRTLEDEQRTAIISGRSALERRGPQTRRSFDEGRRASRPSFSRPERTREVERSRPKDTSRPTRTTTPTTTSSGSGSSSGGTKAARPKPRP